MYLASEGSFQVAPGPLQVKVAIQAKHRDWAPGIAILSLQESKKRLSRVTRPRNSTGRYGNPDFRPNRMVTGRDNWEEWIEIRL